MVALKQLTVLAAFIVAAALLPAEPARALTATAHPDLLGSERLAPVQAVGQHRCHGYRNGRRIIAIACPGATASRSGGPAPLGRRRPTVTTSPGADSSLARIVRRSNS